MQQKKTWRLLSIGKINKVFILLMFLGMWSLSLIYSCGRKTEYFVQADYIYENTTTHTVTVVGLYSFTLSPDSTHLIHESGFGGKNISADSYFPPGMDLLMYDEIKCDTLDYGNRAGRGEALLGIQNYESEKLGERYYKFTYTFTEEDYNKAVDCK